jgi:hypothetical protein
LGVEDPFRPARKAHPGIVVADEATLDAIAQRLKDAGINVRPDELLPGYRRFYVDDCFGNRLEFMADTPRGPAIGRCPTPIARCRPSRTSATDRSACAGGR